MNAKTISSFASGLLVAATVLAIVYFFGPQDTIQTKAEEKLSIEELEKLITSEGYVVHTHAEWEELVAAADVAKEAETKATVQAEKETKEQTNDEVSYRTILTVSEGMTSIDVGRALVSANIIGNAMDFTREVEKRGVAKYLKLGTYEIDSGMSVDEIIKAIFKSR